MSAATDTKTGTKSTAAAASTGADSKIGKTYKAYVCEAAGKPLVVKEIPFKPIAADEVEVKILASGICASDVDALSGKYPPQMYPFPMIAGHEGVGVVTAVGSLVKTHKVGTRVGLGVSRSCCNSCRPCTSGDSNLCGTRETMFSFGRQGTFAEYTVIKAQFAIPIADHLFSEAQLESLGPLFCAGVTVYAPFQVHNIRGGESVAVLGIGGLGHLALKVANKWGCSVTALSRDKSKKESILAMGAHKFVDTKEDPELKSVANSFNYILLTGAGPDVNFKALFTALAPGGKIILMGIPSMGDISVNPVQMILGQKSIAGSAAGSLGSYHHMVNFFGIHQILPQNEKFAFKDINEAIAKVKEGTLRYRAVVSHALNDTPKK